MFQMEFELKGCFSGSRIVALSDFLLESMAFKGNALHRKEIKRI
jgi:hypothetical protein